MKMVEEKFLLKVMTYSFYKQHFYKKGKTEIGKNSNEC